MGIEDYSKKKASVQKIAAENAGIWKDLSGRVGASVKRAASITENLTAGLEGFGAHRSTSDDQLARWAKIADQIIALQKEEKAALKAKDKEKAREIGKKIALLDREASAVEALVQETIGDANALKNGLLATMKVLEQVPA